jgi:hypothetical protein
MAPEQPEPTWISLVLPYVARLELAAALELNFVHRPEGARPFAAALRQMAGALDRAVAMTTEPPEPTWISVFLPVVERLELAAALDINFVYKPECARWMALHLRGMAKALDRAVALQLADRPSCLVMVGD